VFLQISLHPGYVTPADANSQENEKTIVKKMATVRRRRRRRMKKKKNQKSSNPTLFRSTLLGLSTWFNSTRTLVRTLVLTLVDPSRLVRCEGRRTKGEEFGPVQGGYCYLGVKLGSHFDPKFPPPQVWS
jgi:hypothetical protein